MTYLYAVTNDPIHRVLADSHPELYWDYICAKRSLEMAQHMLRGVERKLKSNRQRVNDEQRAALRVRRSELQARIADREAVRAYKITRLFEAESTRIQSEIDGKRMILSR